MRGGSVLFLFIVIAALLLIDLYTFRSIRYITIELSTVYKSVIYSLFWLVPLFILCMITIMFAYRDKMTDGTNYIRTFFPMMAVFVLFYVPKLFILPFQVVEDLAHLTTWIIDKFTEPDSVNSSMGTSIDRRHFISKTGLIFSAIPFLTIAHGIIRGRYNYKVNRLRLSFNNLPKSFNGFKVLQISDWHIGSFAGNIKRIEDAVELINSQAADLILFTGDLVNNVATEVEEFIPALKKLKARYGVFSVMGNHDYGEYVDWKSDEEWKQNIVDLEKNQRNAGFRLLKNEHIKIEKGSDHISIIGVENWGLPPFPQYGDLPKAMEGVEESSFKILMSHDPSHWDAEVKGRTKIELVLSGHTHGMQFGINIPGIKWSPVKWKYPRWAGLYQEDLQKLYVNVGIGYIGFPGRVGFYPEISVFELHQG